MAQEHRSLCSDWEHEAAWRTVAVMALTYLPDEVLAAMTARAGVRQKVSPTRTGHRIHEILAEELAERGTIEHPSSESFEDIPF